MIIWPALLLGCFGQNNHIEDLIVTLYGELILADTSVETALTLCQGFYDESKIA